MVNELLAAVLAYRVFSRLTRIISLGMREGGCRDRPDLSRQRKDVVKRSRPDQAEEINLGALMESDVPPSMFCWFRQWSVRLRIHLTSSHPIQPHFCPDCANPMKLHARDKRFHWLVAIAKTAKLAVTEESQSVATVRKSARPVPVQTRQCKNVGGVLSKVYKPWLDHVVRQSNSSESKSRKNTASGAFDNVVDLDSVMADFEDHIPSHLHWKQESPRNDNLRSSANMRLSHVLHARFLHLRVLLHRPILAKFCQHQTQLHAAGDADSAGSTNFDTDLSSSFSRCSALACVRAAIELVELTYESHTSEATGAW
jgi:hypothetical protein